MAPTIVARSAAPAHTILSLPNNAHRNWWQDAGMRKLAFFSLIGYLGTVNNGYDGSLINGLFTMPLFNGAIEHASGGKLGFMTAAYSLGCFIALSPAAIFSDKFGRKACILVGAILTIAGALEQGFTKGLWAMWGGRFIIGLGSGFQTIGSPTLVAEITHPRNRSQATALTQTCWYVGSIIAAWVTFGTLKIPNDWCWRVPCLIQALPGVLQLSALYWCPESPRFLMRIGKEQQALDVLATYHANGDVDDELVQCEFKEIKDAIAFETAAAAGTSYMAFFKTKGNRHRLSILVLLGFLSQWVGNGVISYYFAAILESVGLTDPTKQAGLNGGLQIWNWLLAIGGALAIERVGRRPLWLISACGLLATFIVITACSATYAKTESAGAGYTVIAFIFFNMGFFDIAFTPMALSYPVEILPYSLRTKGLGISQSCVYAALFFNQFVNPIALEAIAWKYYIVYCVLITAMICIIYFLFPETKGRTLEEIAEIFDGHDAPNADALVLSQVDSHRSDQKLDEDRIESHKV
ncbi:hypothetical protein IAT40_005834 [Kwoniella sp. CBS 6097]